MAFDFAIVLTAALSSHVAFTSKLRTSLSFRSSSKCSDCFPHSFSWPLPQPTNHSAPTPKYCSLIRNSSLRPTLALTTADSLAAQPCALHATPQHSIDIRLRTFLTVAPLVTFTTITCLYRRTLKLQQLASYFGNLFHNSSLITAAAIRLIRLQSASSFRFPTVLGLQLST